MHSLCSGLITTGSIRIWTIWHNDRKLPNGHTNRKYPAR